MDNTRKDYIKKLQLVGRVEYRFMPQILTDEEQEALSELFPVALEERGMTSKEFCELYGFTSSTSQSMLSQALHGKANLRKYIHAIAEFITETLTDQGLKQ